MGASSGQAAQGVGAGLMGLSMQNQAAGIATSGANLQSQMDIQGSQFESELALQGANYNASVYRSYMPAVASQTAYAEGAADSQYANQQQALSSQITQNMSHNQAVQGMSGMGFGSKSYLSVAASNLNNAELQIINMRNNEVASKNQIAFEGDLEQTKLANQANAAEYSGKVQSAAALYQGQVNATMAQYQGQVAAYQAQSGNGQNIGNSVSSGISLLGSL